MSVLSADNMQSTTLHWVCALRAFPVLVFTSSQGQCNTQAGRLTQAIILLLLLTADTGYQSKVLLVGESPCIMPVTRVKMVQSHALRLNPRAWPQAKTQEGIVYTWAARLFTISEILVRIGYKVRENKGFLCPDPDGKVSVSFYQEMNIQVLYNIADGLMKNG